MEIWKAIPSDPTLEASSLGRIRVIPHEVALPYGGYRLCGGQPTFGQWAKDQRRFVYCRRGYPTRKVARLVCEAFNGLALEGQVAMHIDEDSTNNRADNLKWGTQKENLNCPKFLEYCGSRTGVNNPRYKGRMSERT